MSCIGIPSETFGDFAYRLYERAAAKHLPIGISVELTERCNVSCVHCYLAHEPRPEMSTATVKRLLDEAAELGALWLMLTGGEPLTRPDFEELYIHAKRAGLIPTLFTNATLITDEVADMLAEYPPMAVEITLHSMDKDTFERVSRVPGSFDACMAGITRLRQRALPIRLKSVALTINSEGLVDVDTFAASIDSPYRFDPHVMPRMNGGTEPFPYRLSPEQIVALDRAFDERLEGWEHLVRTPSPSGAVRIFQCGAGSRMFHVSAHGGVSPCLLTTYNAQPYEPGHLREAWDSFIPRFVSRPADPDYRCGGCEKAQLCGRCVGWSVMETGDEQAPVEYLCEVGERRLGAIREKTALQPEAAAMDRGAATVIAD